MYLKNKKLFSLLISLLISSLAILVNKLNVKVIEITEKEKCPACFGISLCPAITDNKITFDYDSFNSVFNNLFSIKNVFFGTYNNVKVVMKKLAQNSELKAFDEMICSNNQLNELCFKNSKKVYSSVNFHQLILSELQNSSMNDPNIKLRLCPTVEHFDDILSNVERKSFMKSDDYYKFLWSSIKINPEPIILQMLLAEDDWPTPKYYGACGRLIVEKFIGLPLSAYYEETWIKRAKIASSLLDAAYKFTFKNPMFAVYLTDISMDNIVINDNDEAIFIDLENIIIVDKFPSKNVLRKMARWNDTYEHKIEIDCQDCFVFSPHDICSHQISDHNYYAICQHILMEEEDETSNQMVGLLHDPPSTISKQLKKLVNLLLNCSKSSKNTSRITSGMQLKKMLDEIIEETKET